MNQGPEQSIHMTGEATVSGHVIVCGFGPIGRAVCEQATQQSCPVVVVELNPATVERCQYMPQQIIEGDMTDPQTLRGAKIETATALVITIPDEQVAIETCRVARQLRGDIFILVRATHLSKGMQPHQAGANQVIINEIVTATAMQQQLDTFLGDTPQASRS